MARGYHDAGRVLEAEIVRGTPEADTLNALQAVPIEKATTGYAGTLHGKNLYLPTYVQVLQGEYRHEEGGGRNDVPLLVQDLWTTQSTGAGIPQPVWYIRDAIETTNLSLIHI